MRNYAKILPAIWGSKKFQSLRDDDRSRLLYFYFHTCSQVNSVGCFYIPPGYVATDLEWPLEVSQSSIDRLSGANLIDWNAEESIVMIVDYIFHDPPTNPKHALALAKVATKLPDCPQKLRVINDLMSVRFGEDISELKAESDRILASFEKTADSLSKPRTLTLTPTLTQTKKKNPPSREGGVVALFEDPNNPRSPPAEKREEDTDEARFWRLATELEPRDVAKSQCGQLANLLNGDFADGIAALQAASRAKEPARYLGAIIRNRGSVAQNQTSEPAWVREARQAGAVVTRDGDKWSMAGSLYDSEGEQVGF